MKTTEQKINDLEKQLQELKAEVQPRKSRNYY